MTHNRMYTIKIINASGMSHETLLSTTLGCHDVGLHWMNVSFNAYTARVSVARYTHILPQLNLCASLILLIRIVFAIFRRYCSIVLQKLLHIFCVGCNFFIVWVGFSQ
jgi:hypothetical protein